MTKKELSQLYYLKKEEKQLQQQVEELRSKVEKVTTTVSDMPKGGQKKDLRDELIDLIDLLALKQKQCVVEQNRLERYIATVDDSYTRLILSLRYISGMSWGQIALKVGGGNTAENVRQTIHRFLKKRENQNLSHLSHLSVI